MALAKVLSYIDTIMHTVANRDLNKANPKRANDGKRFLKVLDQIYKYIVESDDGNHLSKFEDALLYIQEIPIAGFLNTHSFLDQASAIYPYFIVEKQPRNLPKAPEINNRYKDFIECIYLALMENYRLLRKHKHVAWTYRYPITSATQEVNNDGTQTWETIMDGPFGAKEAMVDFLRDTTVMGMTKKYSVEAEVLEILQNLVNQAGGYDKKDKPLLLAWLKSKGGQANAGIAGYLIHYKQFTDEQAFLGQTKVLEQHWFIKNGKIYFTADIGIYAILEEQKAICMDPAKKGDQGTAYADMSLFVDHLSKEGWKPFLMRVKSLIELEVIEDPKKNRKVAPKVRKIDVISYSNIVKSPARLVENQVTDDDEKRPYLERRMSYS